MFVNYRRQKATDYLDSYSQSNSFCKNELFEMKEKTTTTTTTIALLLFVVFHLDLSHNPLSSMLLILFFDLEY